MNPFHRVMSGGGRPIFLFDDEFLANASAPLASPRTAEPGPGTLTITDTGNKATISGGKIRWPSAAGDFDPKFAVTTSQTRAAGLAFITPSVVAAGGNYIMGFFSALALGNSPRRGVIQLTTVGISIVDSGGNAILIVDATAPTVGTAYDVAVVLRGTGAFYFIRGGAYTSWTLLFVDGISNLATVFAGFAALTDVTSAYSVEAARQLVLGGTLATDSGCATVNVTASSGVTQTADADGVYSLAFTLPAGSANLVAAELRYRWQDATNYWTAYIKRNAGNTAWDFYLDKVTAGTPATQTGYPVTGVGTVAEIEVRANGTKHNTWTRVASTWTKRGGEISDAAFQTSTTIDPIAGAGTTLGVLLCFPYQSALYNGLNAT